MRRLIINADDFGLTSGVNRGIVESHAHGVVTSATLMACGEKFAEAAVLSAQEPRLSVGCHVVLVDGVPVLDAATVPSLTVGPKFRDRLTNFAMRAASGRLDPEVEAEVTAQIQKLQAARYCGFPSGLAQAYPYVPGCAEGDAARRQKVRHPGVRNPFEPLVVATVRHWKRQFQLRLMRRFRAGFQEALVEAGVVTPDGCVGIAATGGLTQELSISCSEPS